MKVRSSPSSDDDARYSLYGAFAFGSIILTCFAGFFFTSRYYLPEQNVLYTFALGAVYAALGVLGNHCMRLGKGAEVAYFAVQCSVLTAMIFLSPIRGFFGLIVLPIASQAIFVFRPPGAATICLYLFALSVSLWGFNYGWGAALEASTNYLAGFSFTIIFTIFTRNALVAREISETLRRELETANDQLRAQAAQTEELATTRERNRVAREIHDGVGHYLTVVKTQLDAAAAILPGQPDQARAAILKAARLAGDALDDVRRSVGTLRTDNASPPLPEALRALAAESGLPATVRLEGTVRPVPPGIEHALFRSAQEALTNIRKHAGAAATEVLLDFRTPGCVSLAITDNGRGVNGTPAAGFGLRGMAERIEVLGGRVQTGNRPGGGFALTVEVPA